MSQIEQTLVMIKPDGVGRAIIGRIISRFEDVGLKIVGLKLIQVDSDFASRHYTEDITKRRGASVRKNLIKMLGEGPVVAMVLEGVEAIGYVRKMVGETEPKAAAPGTIRADFSHMSYGWSDKKNFAVRNVIHASSSPSDAVAEIALWFSNSELFDYKMAHDPWVR